MQLVFTKGSGKNDRMDVLKNGEIAGTITCPKQGIIPHDMVHYAVESTLQKRGFLGRIRDGESASFRMIPEQESDSVEGLVEVFQADGWSGWHSELAAMIALYQVTCRSRECPSLSIDVADIDAVRQRLLELSRQWQVVPVGGSLHLRFDQEIPHP